MKFKDEAALGGSSQRSPAEFFSAADSGSLAPTALGSPGQLGGADDERPRRRGVVIGWFTAGIVVGLVGAVLPVRWLIHANRWPGASSAASALIAPSAAPAASPSTGDPSPPPAPACPPLPLPEPCSTIATAVPVAGAPAKATGRSKGHKRPKAHVEAASAKAAPPAAQAAPAQAESAATPAFVQAARAMVDHAAESELTDSLK